jgi:hypothetical protein
VSWSNRSRANSQPLFALKFVLIDSCSCSAGVRSHRCMHAAIAGPHLVMALLPGALRRTAVLARCLLEDAEPLLSPCSPSLSVSPSCSVAHREHARLYRVEQARAAAARARALAAAPRPSASEAQPRARCGHPVPHHHAPPWPPLLPCRSTAAVPWVHEARAPQAASSRAAPIP